MTNKPRRKRENVIHIRISDQEKERLIAEAEKLQVSVPELIRLWIERYAK